ncbi:MAG: helix-turn-helix domain-containing protein [Gemmatimonadales bacterium]
MFLAFDHRPSDSPLIDRVWRCRSARAGTFLSVAATHSELVVTRHRGRLRVTLRGPETRPSAIGVPAEALSRRRRTVQRHFLLATGMTHRTWRQIQRARHAAVLLRSGASIAEAVHQAGYYDQAHLTRSLTRRIGTTPARIQRQERQLSFLYKTPAWADGKLVGLYPGAEPS